MNMLKILLILLSLTITAEENLLQADKAFSLTTKIANNNIVLDWKIADGYYLYQNKITVRPIDNSVELGNFIFSTAKVKEDEFFGKVKIYRHNANVTIAIINSQDIINLEVSYQGCADIGVCYPPVHKKIQLNASKIASTNDGTQFFKSIINNEALTDPVQVDKAFPLQLLKIDTNNVQIVFDIRDDYYLYKDKFSFTASKADIVAVKLPAATIKDDEFFGKVKVYKHQLIIPIELNNINNNVTLTINFQGCWEGGVCYPPATKTLAIGDIVKDNVINTILKNNTKAQTAPIVAAELNASDKITHLIETSNVFIVILSFLALGLLLTFTPCVLPMIPILSSIIVGQKEKPSTAKSFFISLIFVLSMAITYTFAGVLAGIFGHNLQIILQDPYVIVAFSLIFIILSFSMFGYFEIKLPNSWQNKLTNISNKNKGGSVIGVAIMGFLSALIVGPCVTPPLTGALIYIGQTGDAVLGGMALFAMGIGMGIPLLIIGTGIGSIPKAGAWMDKVKNIFGVLMLAMAIYLLDRVTNQFISLVMWASLFTISPIAFGATIRLQENSTYWQRILKAINVIILGYGLLLWLLVAKGGGDMLSPLKSFSVQQNTISNNTHQGLVFKKISSLSMLNNITTNNTDKLIMLDFYADWCISCKELERYVFSDDRVVKHLKNSITLQADVTKNTINDKELMQYFGVIGPPAILFFKNGKELKSKRIVGEINADKFYNHLLNL